MATNKAPRRLGMPELIVGALMVLVFGYFLIAAGPPL
jgi:hypothetical protein